MKFPNESIVNMYGAERIGFTTDLIIEHQKTRFKKGKNIKAPFAPTHQALKVLKGPMVALDGKMS